VRLLVIDTSGADCSLALFDDDVLLAERHETIGRGHAERIIPWIADLPGGGKADRILVGCGPGSFTGVRVGIAAARALAIGWGVPVSGFSSLALIAADASQDAEGDEPLLVATEGGHGELFIQPFLSGPVREAGPLASLLPEQAAQSSDIALVAGSAADRLIAARGSGQVLAATPRAGGVLSLDPALCNWPPAPVYGRAPDAKPPAP
jgi:tRNA threonylcarbamoyladenosine biosynthesis protein TsaB